MKYFIIAVAWFCMFVALWLFADHRHEEATYFMVLAAWNHIVYLIRYPEERG